MLRTLERGDTEKPSLLYCWVWEVQKGKQVGGASFCLFLQSKYKSYQCGTQQWLLACQQALVALAGGFNHSKNSIQFWPDSLCPGLIGYLLQSSSCPTLMNSSLQLHITTILGERQARVTVLEGMTHLALLHRSNFASFSSPVGLCITDLPT